MPSGGALDNGSGWARLNLYAAAGGYGAFPSNVTVNMNAALGGFNAFDVWSNDISGPGGLTLQGSGTLVLAGDDTFTGGVNVQGGALGVTGSLLGPLSVSPRRHLRARRHGVFTGVLTNDGSVDNEGVMTGTFAGSGASPIPVFSPASAVSVRSTCSPDRRSRSEIRSARSRSRTT